MARRVFAGVLDQAVAAGVDAGLLARAQAALADGDRLGTAGDQVGAAGAYGAGLDIIAAPGTLVFSVSQFEHNIRAALQDETVGYAYSVTRKGEPTHHSSAGFARTHIDPPVVNQVHTGASR